jgi:hypothetical protein
MIVRKIMMLKIYIGDDELGEHISIEGAIDGKSYSLGSMDLCEYPLNLHEALTMPELSELASMRQLTELKG